MDFQNAANKIRQEHLDKLACIYVRQSTPGGVKRNVVGGRRQREDVIELALQLGWPEANIKVIDVDQAITGTSTHGRYGYLEMLAAISNQCVGAVFSLEASRMARDSAEWFSLIKLCQITGTLVVDMDGVYDPSDPNDGTLMKFKGLLSEMEIRLIYQRIGGARKNLAEKGELRFQPPVGFVYAEGKLILDPNQEIQDAVRLLFTTFDRVRSSAGVAKYFLRNNLKFPSPIPGGSNGREYKWVRLKFGRARAILGNPVYAGTYVYGRSATKMKVYLDPAGIPQIKKYSVNVPQEKWEIVIHDAHEAYITWPRFNENQELIRNNGWVREGQGNRAARVGGGLLQGIVMCGKCGRRMTVKYPYPGGRPAYSCIYETENAVPDQCQSMPGAAIDAAVAKLFLQAVEPAQLKISFEAFERVEEQSRQLDQCSAVSLKRAAVAVDRAKERLLAVDYSNKYAFACVQEELKHKEEELAELKVHHNSAKAAILQNLTRDERQSIERSIQNLPLIWGAATTDMVAKKNLLRCLIQDVTLRREGHIVHVAARWTTLASTLVQIELRKRGAGGKVHPDIIAFIAKLAPDHTNTQIANALNQSELDSKDGVYARPRIGRLRATYKLAAYHLGAYPDQRKDGRYKVTAIAKMLEVSEGVVRTWCANGRLDGVNEAGSGVWWIKLDPEQAAEFKQTIRRCRRAKPNDLNQN